MSDATKNFIEDMKKAAHARDWPEDFDHGIYENKCFQCAETFHGDKRRIQCRECAFEGVR